MADGACNPSSTLPSGCASGIKARPSTKRILRRASGWLKRPRKNERSVDVGNSDCVVRGWLNHRFNRGNTRHGYVCGGERKYEW